MKIYDISRPFFTTPVYEGDPIPEKEMTKQINNGDSYNFTSYSSGCHNATHIDAPAHFISDGKTIEQLPLKNFIGPCTVVKVQGLITNKDIEKIMQYSQRRILFAGDGKAYLSQSGAIELAFRKALLIGTDAQSIAIKGQEAVVHKEILMYQIPIVEGLLLNGVPEGDYIISAFPVKMDGCEGAACRAVLLKG